MHHADLLFPPGATRHDWVLDAMMAFGLGLLTIPPYSIRGISHLTAGAQLFTAALMIGSLVLRRHSPLLALAGVTLAGLGQVVVSDTPMATLVAVPIVAYSVARWIPGHEARVTLAVGAIGAVLGPLRWVVTDPSYLSVKDLVGLALYSFVCMALVVTPYAVGRRVRESSEAHLGRVAAAEERYRTMVAEREQLTRLAESRTRNQIASELHDIVAHSLSVMIVQAEGGRALAAKKPEAATEALTTIAETGREALMEMRRILGVLRDPSSGAADFAPAPRLEDIPELVSRTSDRVQLSIQGRPPTRPSPALELTVYRVVQEALTNFLKHAGPDATAMVTVTYGSTEIVVDVLDNGLGATAGVPETPGHGLRGMSERVASMGGRLHARPRPGGGFQVTAVLPVLGPVSQDGGWR
ncbi:signal transduction histidine kinase [Propionicimonas paludicola]|uniref:histidine kinase n=1 Tax=Propionicimonas paludicola TaxID=185243 RepID=A0A2A9CX38_9ACTN|nr:sensor histidine kinase [Propionicimonas paludicola]PFG18232.1 signal transduction histidine kinase [Propionicimonas paludicola]